MAWAAFAQRSGPLVPSRSMLLLLRWCASLPTGFLLPFPPQWFVLNRKHAELVLRDQSVERLFQLNCYTSLERKNGKMWERVCYSGGSSVRELGGRDGFANCHAQTPELVRCWFMAGQARSLSTWHVAPPFNPSQTSTTSPRCWPSTAWTTNPTARAR